MIGIAGWMDPKLCRLPSRNVKDFTKNGGPSFRPKSNIKTEMNKSVVDLNEADFEQEVLRASSPVLVQFWAGWSGACNASLPLLKSIAEGEAVLKVGRVNVDRHQALATKCGVRAVPTLLIFDHGRLPDQIIGSTTREEVFQKVEHLYEC
jgi:thioredoxin 1